MVRTQEIKSRKMRWARHVACMDEKIKGGGSLKNRGHLEVLGTDGRIILKR